MLQQLSQTDEWDIVIIGGGATGLGSAVDAASRGYKTLLIEQYDFGKGTSSRSTKLIHGGVRYLEQGNLKLVFEALRERGYLLKNAPHLTSTLAFVVPVYSLFNKLYYGIGLTIYDLMSGKLSLGKTKWLNKKQTLEHLPGISDKKLKGGILYFDGQFNDTRLIIELAITASDYGATILNYCKATKLLKPDGIVNAVVFEDTLNHISYTINARTVINATGVFTDSIIQMDAPDEDYFITPSQGIHLVIDRKFFPSVNALMIPKTEDGRVLFAVPWHNKVLLGTTDTPITNVAAEPQPLEEEIEFIIRHANKYLKENIKRSDIKAMFAGLRPLVKTKGSKSTALLSRDHTIIVSKSGLVTVTGGKWTTYRKMAEDAVNNAAFVAKLPERKCVTQFLPIGNKENTSIENENGFKNSFPYSEKTISLFVLNEMAITIEDVLARRTSLLFLDAEAAIKIAPKIAKIMAAIMNKDEQWINEQINSFNQLAKQYYLSEKIIN